MAIPETETSTQKKEVMCETCGATVSQRGLGVHRRSAKCASNALLAQGAQQEPGPDNPRCKVCCLYQTCRTPFMRRTGNGARLFLVGEAPGSHEDEKSGHQFTGPAGMVLKTQIIDKERIPYQDITLQNAVRCKPKVDTPTAHQVRMCRPFLLKDVAAVNPDVVVCLGGVAAQAVLDLHDPKVEDLTCRRFSGIEDVNPDTSVYVTYHPSYALQRRNGGGVVTTIRRHLRFALDGLANTESFPEPIFTMEVPKLRDPVVCFDTEWDIPTKKLRCLSVLFPHHEHPYVTHDRAMIQKLVDYPQIVFVGHNVITDLTILLENGVRLPDTFGVWDTLMMARALLPDSPTRSLKPLARELGLPYYTMPCDDASLEEWERYCSKDVWTTHVLYERGATIMQEHHRRTIDAQNRVVLPLLAMQVAGVRIDKKYLQQHRVDKQNELDSLKEVIPPEVITNDNALRAWLVEKYTEQVLDRCIFRTRKTGEFMVSGDQLKRLPNQRALTPILKARELQDYITAYIEKPLEIIGTGSFFLPEYNIMEARTHRRSTSPTIHNWSDDARRSVISRFHGGQITSHDYSAVEARLFAWEAQDAGFLELLVAHGYPGVAQEVYGWKKAEKGTKEYKVTKETVLASIYNVGTWQLRETMHNAGIRCNWDDVEEWIRKFFRRFPKMEDEKDRRIDFAFRNGYIQNALGVRFPMTVLPKECFATPKMEEWARKRLANQAANTPTQSLLAYLLGAAMVETLERLLEFYAMTLGEFLEFLQWTRKVESCTGNDPGSGFMLVELHDAVITDTGQKYHQEVSEIVVHSMKNHRDLALFGVRLDCPLDVDVKTGRNWKEAS